MKTCTGCGLEKAATEENFYVRKGGFSSRCKPCLLAYGAAHRAANPETNRRRAKEWNAANPEKKAAQIRRTHLRRMGLTPESFDAMLAAQGGACAICKTTEPGGKHNQWHIDHDHSCCPEKGQSCGVCVRSLLCSSCNQGLGHFKDSTVLLEAAITYLERHAKEGVAA